MISDLQYSGGRLIMRKPTRRGKPGRDIHGQPTELVHLHDTTPRAGMRESFSAFGDYPPNAVCKNGNHHLWLVDDVSQVTCPRCLEIAKEERGK